MLPEQIWDEADWPELGLTLGNPMGPAMPLVWAHAEYVKLLRSVTDGEVFDSIAAVANRYAKRPARRTPVEIFRLGSAIVEDQPQAKSCGCWPTNTLAWCGRG